jgi:hypothetical protein
MLKQLREENLIAIDGKNWTVLDPDGLRKAAQYEASYLHLDRARREPNSNAGKRLKGLIRWVLPTVNDRSGISRRDRRSLSI